MYRSFKEMPIWRNAMAIAKMIFNITKTLPPKEDYGLTSQIRRSTLSISANIAEAYGRKHTFDKINFYNFARGSITETQSHLEYGIQVGYFDKKVVKEVDVLLSDCYSSLNKITYSLKNSTRST